ncbi:NAD(P)H-binding protein [Bradyrhizobium oligotrophicum S58]
MTDPRKPSEQARIALVTGGSGFVGGRLISHLLTQGWQVRALARSAEREAQVKALGATPVRGALDNEQALRNAMQGCEIVFHVAAHFKLWGNRKLFDRTNVEGTRIVVNAATSSASVRRVGCGQRSGGGHG